MAEEATGEEYASYWRGAARIYSAFDPYRPRSGDREIPIVVLSPIES